MEINLLVKYFLSHFVISQQLKLLKEIKSHSHKSTNDAFGRKCLNYDNYDIETLMNAFTVRRTGNTHIIAFFALALFIHYDKSSENASSRTRSVIIKPVLYIYATGHRPQRNGVSNLICKLNIC